MLNTQPSGESCPDIDRGFFVAFLFTNDTVRRRSFLYREGLKTFALGWVEQRCKGGRRLFYVSLVTNNAQKTMLQSNQVPEEAYVLLLPKHSFLLDILSDVPGTIRMKNKITEAFVYYLLFSGEGSEESKEYKDEVSCLLMGIHELIDAIAIQNFTEKED